jgi:hypothetical protein
MDKVLVFESKVLGEGIKVFDCSPTRFSLSLTKKIEVLYSERLKKMLKAVYIPSSFKKEEGKEGEWAISKKNFDLDDIKNFFNSVDKKEIKPKGLGLSICSKLDEIKELLKLCQDEYMIEAIESDSDEKNYFISFGDSEEVESRLEDIEIEDTFYIVNLGNKNVQFFSTKKIK